MKKGGKGGWLLLVMALILVGMVCFFSTLKQNGQMRIFTKKETNGSLIVTGEEEKLYDKTVDSYPYYGMSEKDLNHCLLGKPMVISKCSHFDMRRPVDRKKDYVFGYAGQPNSGKISVRYFRNTSGDPGYIEYQPDNGYVDSGIYMDKDGEEYLISINGKTKLEREEEKEKEKKEKKKKEKEEEEEKPTESRQKSGGKLKNNSKGTGSGGGPSFGSTSKKKSTSSTTEFDPDDHDIEGYYEDNRDEYDSIDDAYDAFEDDEDAWDDY